MFGLRTVFDGKVAGRDPYVFASEYAVTTGGGRGNLIVRSHSCVQSFHGELNGHRKIRCQVSQLPLSAYDLTVTYGLTRSVLQLPSGSMMGMKFKHSVNSPHIQLIVTSLT